MNCRRAGELLSPYLEGEISPAHATPLDAHLAECARCRAELADLRRAVGALRTPPALVQPVGLLTEFKSRLETTRRRPHPILRRPVLWLAPAGAIAAGLLIGVAISRNSTVGFRTASHSPAAGSQIASAPQMPSPEALSRSEGDRSPRDAEAARPVASPSIAEQKPSTTRARGAAPAMARTPLAFAPSQPRVPGGRGVTSGLLSRPAGVEEVRDGSAAGTNSAVADSAGRALASARAAGGSRDGLALREPAVTTPSRFAALPVAPSLSGRTDASRRAQRQGRPRLLLPPGVPGPGEVPQRTQIASGRPSPAPPPPPAATGAPAGGAPPSTGFEALSRPGGDQAAAGRAWVAVRYITPPSAPAGQAGSGAGQELRAAAAPEAVRDANDVSAARRSAKAARPSLALSGVTPALLGMMRRPVRVAVADVPLADLVQQIGASAGVTLILDPKVPDTMRCYAQLQDVPLYEALQKVAEATQLVIAPQGAGVTLRPRSGELVSPHSPVWTREWGTALETQFGTQGTEGEKKR